MMRTRVHPTGLPPTLQSMLNILVAAIFIITFLVQPFRIPSESMEPTLLVGDFLLVNKQVFSAHGQWSPLPQHSIQRGDIVVFHYPVNPNMHLVKRVVGLPGDRLHMHGDRVYVNGVALNEPYAVYQPSAPDDFRDNFPNMRRADAEINAAWWIEMRRLLSHGELTVPADRYFVLGDNRNDSEDSRYWGFVPRSAIVGQPLLIYFSLRNQRNGRGMQDEWAEAPQERMRSGIGDFLKRLARWDRVGHVIR